MKTSYGHFSDPPAVLGSFARLRFPSAELSLTWKHCSSSADYFSQFFAGVFAARDAAADVNDLSHSIAYMANELIENVVKFRAVGEVEIEAGLAGDDFVLRIRNPISAVTSRGFQELLATLTSRDPGELLLEQIEANAAGDQDTGSGLGLLTLMNDYGARLGWQFEQPDGQPEADVLLKTEARLTVAT